MNARSLKYIEELKLFISPIRVSRLADKQTDNNSRSKELITE